MRPTAYRPPCGGIGAVRTCHRKEVPSNVRRCPRSARRSPSLSAGMESCAGEGARQLPEEGRKHGSWGFQGTTTTSRVGHSRIRWRQLGKHGRRREEIQGPEGGPVDTATIPPPWRPGGEKRTPIEGGGG